MPACPLCHSDDLELLTERLRHGPGRVFYCGTCEIGILDAESGDLKQYYERDYRELHGPRIGVRSDYEEIFEAYVDYQGQRIEMLRPWLEPEARLLEVGCSTGHFLYGVKDLVGEVVGVDYDSGAAAYAAKKCGCRTYGGDLAESGQPERSFDVVCAMQVMEHVDDPVGLAELLRRYLKPEGIVYVEVPNLRDPLLSVYGVEAYRSFYFHDAHMLYMTERSLRTIMERAGFEGGVRFMQDYNLLNHVHWVVAQRPQESNRPGMGPPVLPLRGELAAEVRDELGELLARSDREYRELLARHGATDNMAFIGSPRAP